MPPPQFNFGVENATKTFVIKEKNLFLEELNGHFTLVLLYSGFKWTLKSTLVQYFVSKLFDMLFKRVVSLSKHAYDISLISAMGCLSLYFRLIHFWYLNTEMI